ncbi:hypothetical protein SKAU_G00337190 [Synaphobranchus kaupii]|uniref:BUB1 N-terminal domain-containing protein n=1 Tax=Synaphobranchus kaupii TaxID=118154 RepID=A0A9Q1IGW6_SYNKA|nr:hypothetical protein SKAU_G00337190 [Synaphobranchus kaupii]
MYWKLLLYILTLTQLCSTSGSIMAEGEAEWELSKENIQPLRQGRAISALHQALSQQQEGSSYTAIQQTTQAFESELRMYSGDDPLDVWDRYIRWTQQTYPQGGKESNLSVLLERAVMRFADEKNYHNDIRYVSLWIKFAENSTEPLDFYTYMHGQGIGIMQAAFYIAWSEEFEKHSNSKKADAIYQEGIKCGAEPRDKLQQYHKAFQARVSRQVVLNMTSGGQGDSPESAQPERLSLAVLKHRGKKKAIVPINRTGASVSHHAHGLNLNLPAATHQAQNSQMVVFNENQAGAAAESFEPRPEQWLAPPVARAKENELMPEKWTNVRMPQKSKFGHSVVVPPSKPNFLPFVEESDQPPAVTPCKINPAVNTVLSARKPSKEENPLERLQEQQQQQSSGQTREQSMYCKELLLSGAAEFCFEELRAERYRKKFALDLEDKEAMLRMVKDELKRQIEEKQRLLLEKSQEAAADHQAQHYATESDVIMYEEHPMPGPSAISEGSATGFKVFDESNASSSGICPLKVYGDSESAGSIPDVEMVQMNEAESNGMPFAVFDESAMCEQPQEVAPMVVSKPSARKPLCAILKPRADVPATRPPSESDGMEGIEPLIEDAIIGSYRNYTLCHIPEDTCDFARAAQLASTPFSGGPNHRPCLSMESGLAEDLSAVSVGTAQDVPTFTSTQDGFDGALRVKKLSPIQEASLEDGSYSGSSVSSSTLSGASSTRTTNLSIKPDLGPSAAAQVNEPNASATEVEDPTSGNVRRRVLGNIDLSSFPNFHKKSGPLPAVNEHEVLSAGDETFVILSGIISSESYAVHFGQTKSSENVVMKVDLHPIPWDFYINTLLRNRLGSDSHKYFSDQSRCFLYDGGCITVSWGHYQGTLQECLAQSPFQENVTALIAIELLELVGQMHSCHLVHGGLRPNTLLLRHRTGCEGLDSVLRAVDFSHSLDLGLQPEVTSVLGHPEAQAFLKQGVLSSSSSPYQMDLLGIAETVHVMLEKRSMQLVCKDSEWELAEDLEVASGNPEDVWCKFFRTILNPGTQSTVTVLLSTDLYSSVEGNLLSCSSIRSSRAVTPVESEL